MRSLYLAGFLFIFLFQAKGQTFALRDNTIKRASDLNLVYETQAAYLDSLYSKRVDIEDELINGREYVPYYFKCRLKPLIADTKVHTGTLVFDGRRYDKLDLDYDTYLDQLIYSDQSKLINDKVFKLALNWNPVDEFIISFGADSMLFRHLGGLKDPGFNLPEAFYEIYHSASSAFIVRHQSFLLEKEGIYEYTYTPAKFVQTGAGFIKVRSAASFLKAFGNEADAVRKFMRTNRVRFRKAGKTEIATVMRYYDNLVATKK